MNITADEDKSQTRGIEENGKYEVELEAMTIKVLPEKIRL